MILLLLLPALVFGQIELQSNVSSLNVTTEDDESFQNQEQYHVLHHCNATTLEILSEVHCAPLFDERMADIGTEAWCDWDQVIRPYNELALCIEEVSAYMRCFFPNQGVQNVFVRTHSQYFHDCLTEEDVEDSVRGIVIVLTLIPVSLIPVLVFMVVWKSKVRD